MNKKLNDLELVWDLKLLKVFLLYLVYYNIII